MGWLALNGYSFVSLVVLLLLNHRYHEPLSDRRRSFTAMAVLLMALTVADSFARLGSTPGYPILFAEVGNFLTYGFDPLIVFLWMRYLGNWIEISEAQKKRWMFPVLLFVLLNFLILLLSQVTGWYYWFDPQGRYHRGPGFGLRAILFITTMVYSEVYVLTQRGKISGRYIPTLVVFSLVPLLCGILQALIYGFALEYAGTTMSLVVIYVFLQDRDVNIDYLTGAFNRRKLDFTLQELVRERKRFAEIMIDLDHFKRINDTYGHAAGDAALQDTMRILLRCFPKNALIARYGGDEFCVFLPSMTSAELDGKLLLLDVTVADFNAESGLEYALTFSIGVGVYDPDSAMSAEAFQKMVDGRLYQNKQERMMVREDISRPMHLA